MKDKKRKTPKDINQLAAYIVEQSTKKPDRTSDTLPHVKSSIKK
jgi:hypothetical protein